MSSAGTLPILAATGMLAEARIAEGPGIITLAGGGDPARLALMLQAALGRGAKGVISFGIAGGLAPGHAAGTAILAQAVHDDGTRFPTDPAWVRRLAARLPTAIVGDLVGVDRPVSGADGKAALHRDTGAVAVDMESHIAARLAAQHGVPFIALRMIADPAHRTLPEAAMVGMRPDGRMDAPAVIRALLRRPGDIPALIRTALDASAAFAALAACRRLSDVLGFEDAVAEAPEALPGLALDVGLFGAQGEIQVGSG